MVKAQPRNGPVRALLRLTLLPVRAPFLVVLLAVSAYLGMQWVLVYPHEAVSLLALPRHQQLFWSVECLHSLMVVVLCSMPGYLLAQVSRLMNASKVFTLVFSLLVVSVLAIYMIDLGRLLAEVMILGSSVFLARLDLARIKVVPPPPQLAFVLSIYVLAGIGLWRWLFLEGILGPFPA